MKYAIFNLESHEPASPKKHWLGNALIFCLISASTAMMMFCPCDIVGIHDHFAIYLVASAALFGLAAAYLIYRRMSRDSAITEFLRAIIALAIVGVSVYMELCLAMEAVSWMARRQ